MESMWPKWREIVHAIHKDHEYEYDTSDEEQTRVFAFIDGSLNQTKSSALCTRYNNIT